MDITGTLHFVGETIQVSDKFKKRDFVIKDNSNSQYPQLIQFQVTQDKCDIIDRPIGSELTIHFNLRGRGWTNPQGEKKYFNTLEAWKIIGATPQQSEMKKEDIAHQSIQDESDLPF
jgi:hypothetical protein